MSSPFSVICDVKAQRHRFVASPNRLRQRHRFRPVAERLLLVDRDVQRLDHDAERRRRGAADDHDGLGARLTRVIQATEGGIETAPTKGAIQRGKVEVLFARHIGEAVGQGQTASGENVGDVAPLIVVRHLHGQNGPEEPFRAEGLQTPDRTARLLMGHGPDLRHASAGAGEL
ncbi:MAG: hypothetical protein ABSF14_08305 [Terriglobia bacterium]|jgi:hypothetical protein